VREPDPAFPTFLLMLSLTVPMGIGFLPLGLLALQAILMAVLGAEAFLARLVGGTLRAIWPCILPLLATSVVGLWGLGAYVAVKLRRTKRQSPDERTPI